MGKKTLVVANVITFVFVAYVALQLKASKTYRPKPKDRGRVMLTKAKTLEDAGQFEKATLAYRGAKQVGLFEERQAADQGLRRSTALLYISQYASKPQATKQLEVLADELNADGPNNRPYGHLIQALALVTRGQLEPAAAKAVQLAKIESLSPWPSWLLGRISLTVKNFSNAGKHLEQVVQKLPKFAAARYYLGRAYTGQKKHESAVDTYAQAMELGAEPSARIALGDGLLSLKRWEHAEKTFKGALERGQVTAPVLSGMAAAQTGLGRYRHGSTTYEKAYELTPNPKYLMAAARALRQGKHLDQAITLLGRISPQEMPVVLFERGLVLSAQGKDTPARNAFEQFIDHTRNDPAHEQAAAEARRRLTKLPP